MKYKVGDIVTLAVTRQYSNGAVITAGTNGIVIKVYPYSLSYLVKFNGNDTPRRISEIFLT